MKKRHYYALTDSYTGDYPKNYTNGFANTKTAIAFRSKKERKAWIDETKLLSAKPITRSEAIAYAETDHRILQKEFDVAKIIRVHIKENHAEYGEIISDEYIVLSGVNY